MSICLGCVVSAGAFSILWGTGQVTAYLASLRRDRAMKRAMEEWPNQPGESWRAESATALAAPAARARSSGRPWGG